jgi:hypothetical protein
MTRFTRARGELKMSNIRRVLFIFLPLNVIHYYYRITNSVDTTNTTSHEYNIIIKQYNIVYTSRFSGTVTGF